MAKIVTAKELGSYLRLSDSTIYKLASDGEIPGFKIGDSWRFDMDEVLHHIKATKRIIREALAAGGDEQGWKRREGNE